MSRGKLPYGNDRKAQNASRVDKFLGKSHGGSVDEAQGVGHYKRGGAVEDAGTRISINIAPPGGPPAPPLPMIKPPAPPMPPPGPGPAMGAPPMPGGPPGPPMGMKMPGMKRGGGVSSMDAGAASGKGRLEKTRLEKRAR